MRLVSRRAWVRQVGVSTLLLPAAVVGAREVAADVVIVGGGVGGCAAALSALRRGLRVVMTEEYGWLGGQLTSQAVPPDEHPYMERFGGTALYREFRTAVRAHYRRHYPLTAEARAERLVNPGRADVSDFTWEPPVSLAVLEEMLRPHVSGGRLVVLLRHRPVAAEVERDRVRSVTVEGAGGQRRTLSAPYFLDATEQGDLLPLTRTEFVTGFEPRRETQEPNAPAEAQPRNIQAFTVCFALEHRAGEEHTIDRPNDYAFWRDYVPLLRPAWPGRLLSWTYASPRTGRPVTAAFDPAGGPVPEKSLNLWTYRRVAAREAFTPGAYDSDLTLVNWPQNDYWLGDLHTGTREEAARHERRARELSLSLLYWMQTAAPRADGGQGWPGLRLRPDQTGTEDGLAQAPYIREARRLRAEFTVLEQHVSTDARMRETGKGRDEVEATGFADTVGVGSYRIDLHPTTTGDGYLDISSLPFQIPLGSLLPRRVENLLAAGKCLGVTHITNGCYRLHPVEWNVGESAAELVAHCLRTRQTPRQVRNEAEKLEEFQKRLVEAGVELRWPKAGPR